ncbi:MAG: SBBP repeat-containing protein [Ignavibacteriae bacterium]|nr:SBBP repeat-containing protein [Ignavibacteria bacterium]MBI3364240.1 SBBP repeat-containing protein [Ignavibacteriota bacterium]
MRVCTTFVVFCGAMLIFAQSKTLCGVNNTKTPVAQNLFEQPLLFERNIGQSGTNVQYFARSAGATTYFFTEQGVSILLTKQIPRPVSLSGLPPLPRNESAMHAHSLKVAFVGANPSPVITSEEETGTTSNYFVGYDPSRWRSDVSLYRRIRCHDLYKGIDLVYYGNGMQLEYDFIVSPGADPKIIKIRCDGADEALRLAKDGSVSIVTSVGVLTQKNPVIYQTQEGNLQKVKIAGEWKIVGSNELQFAVGTYDRTKTLCIDPLLYSTYLGGSSSDEARAIAVDGSGNVYVAGMTSSTDFPTRVGAYSQSLVGATDIFVTKFGADGECIVYSTYIGPASSYAVGLAVDANGDAVVAGSSSGGIPTTPGAYQTGIAGSDDAFVLKLNPTGSSLVYSTYLGGTNGDNGTCVAVDGNGDILITGSTQSSTFPTTAGAYDVSLDGVTDVFVSKIRPDASIVPASSQLLYSTFLGGTGPDLGGYFEDNSFSITVDGSGNAYVVGFTSSADFPTTGGAFDQTLFGLYDCFVTKLIPNTAIVPATGQLVYSTFLGGAGTAYAQGVAVDASGNAYVTGKSGGGFPTVSGAYSPASDGAFVVKMIPNSSIVPASDQLVYSSVLGGSTGITLGRGIAVDEGGMVYVAGTTNATDFPTTTDAYDATYNGGESDIFIAKLNPNASIAPASNQLLYSSYLGGNGSEGDLSTLEGGVVAVNQNHEIYVGGLTESSDFPVTTRAFDPSLGDVRDGFLAKLSTTSVACPSWTQRYENVNPTFEQMGFSIPTVAKKMAHALAIDASGNAYVAGYRTGTTNFDYLTLKYDASGTLLWNPPPQYNNPAVNSIDKAYAVCVDKAGNVYVTGESKVSGSNYDIITIKYDPSGTPSSTWGTVGADGVGIRRYAGPANGRDAGYAIALSPDESVVYVTGESKQTTSPDVVTIAYNTSDGSSAWSGTARVYNGPGNGVDKGYAIAVDHCTGDIVVVGESKGANADYITLRYRPDGTNAPGWPQRYDNSKGSKKDYAFAVALDPDGNVYVAGAVDNGPPTSFDYGVLKYSPAGSLTKQIYDAGKSKKDYAYAIALDAQRNVYVTGASNGGSATRYDYATVKLNSSLTKVWESRYDAGVKHDDIGRSIAVCDRGYVYVTGNSYFSKNDYVTLRYPTGGSGIVSYDQIGRYHFVKDDIAYNIALREEGACCCVVLTGESQNAKTDIATIQGTGCSALPAGIVSGSYESDGTENESPYTFALNDNYPNPFNPTTTIQFTLPQYATVTLKVFNILGQEVATLLDRELLDEGVQEVDFEGGSLSSGVYFYKLVAETSEDNGEPGTTYTAVKKMMLLK